MFFHFQGLEIIGQLVLAVILGGLIGVERELRKRLAGIRTHALVCLGAALFSYLSVFGFSEFNFNSVFFRGIVNFDPSRIASQIVIGIGFLGAGLIVLQESKVQGLTTAAGIWATSAIGMAVGFKMYFVALAATLLILLIHTILFYIENRIGGNCQKDKDD